MLASMDRNKDSTKQDKPDRHPMTGRHWNSDEPLHNEVVNDGFVLTLFFDSWRF